MGTTVVTGAGGYTPGVDPSGSISYDEVQVVAARAILGNPTNASAAVQANVLGAFQTLRGNSTPNALETTARRVQVHTVTAGEASAQVVVLTFGLTAIACSVSYRTAAGVAVEDWVATATATQVSLAAGATAFVAGDVVTVTAEGA